MAQISSLSVWNRLWEVDSCIFNAYALAGFGSEAPALVLQLPDLEASLPKATVEKPC